jgi:outer membrane protein W
MPSIGYNWHPFKSQFYIKPWFGLGYTSKISGDNSINNVEYNISPFVPFATVHVGYTFNK